MNIKAVLFDLDDTLLWDDRSVKEAFEATCAYAEQKTGVTAALLEEEVRKEARRLYATYETFPFTKQIGINPFEALWARFSHGHQPEFRKLEELAPTYRKLSWTRGLLACGVDDPILGHELGERFPQERRNRPLVYEETFEVLNQLKGNFKLLLLTNGSPDLQQEKIDSVPALSAYFDHIVISGTFGQGKPAAAIFHHAADLLGIHPSEGLMVGDKLTTDILGSNTIGMPNAWINRRQSTRTDEIVPKFEITNLRELHNVIRQLNEG